MIIKKEDITMNIERMTDSKFIVFFTRDEAAIIKVIAQTFHKGNKSTTLKEIIEEGTQLSVCVKELLEDKEDTEILTKRFCETQIDKVGRLWKGKDDGC